MPESVDAFRYFSYLRSRWRFIAASCAIAVGLTLAFTLTLPNKYKATCRVLIEPPAGTDIRSALVVSPIYLESLKTYEHFATSDSLFLRALDQFHLRQRFPGRAVESLKAGILKVGMVRDTKILEIQVTLPDPKTAQALALYLGEETVKLSRTVAREGDRELTQGIEKEEQEARAKLDLSETAWARMLAEEPIEGLQQQIQNGSELRSSLDRQRLRAEMDAADAQLNDVAAARARAETLRKQIAELDRQQIAAEDLMARRLADRDRLDGQRTASQTAYNAVESRMEQARGDLGYRGERLKIIDPGIVPERPSSPNLFLSLFAALVLGIVAPVVYLTVVLSYEAQRPTARRATLRVTGTGRDD